MKSALLLLFLASCVHTTTPPVVVERVLREAMCARASRCQSIDFEMCREAFQPAAGEDVGPIPFGIDRCIHVANEASCEDEAKVFDACNLYGWDRP